MIEEFLSLDIPSRTLADSLNKNGKEGWLIVNCWPASADKVTVVFRRPRVFFNTATKRYEPALPLSLLSLEAALARCIAPTLGESTDKKTDSHSRPLARLAEEFAASEEDVAEQLKSAGLKEWAERPITFSARVGIYSLWIHRKSEKDRWTLWAKKVKDATAPKPSAKAAKPAPSHEAKPFSVDDAIAFCIEQPPIRTFPHGITLEKAAKKQHVDTDPALVAFRQIGLPTADHKDPEKRYVRWNGREVALSEWKEGIWYLNVKQVEPNESTAKPAPKKPARTSKG